MNIRIDFKAPIAFSFAGADDATDIDAMIDLGKRYPNIEYGILLHPEKFGQPRYPTLGWVMEFVDKFKEYTDIFNTERLDGDPSHSWHRPMLSAHLCGDYAFGLLEDGYFGLEELIDSFTYVQINAGREITHEEEGLLKQWTANYNKNIILQMPEPPSRLIRGVGRILLDGSRGQGQVRTEWPECNHMADSFGYEVGIAGGINADNIHDVCRSFLRRNYRVRYYYVDMESGIRDENNEFCLNKVEAVLRRFNEKMVFDQHGEVWTEVEHQRQLQEQQLYGVPEVTMVVAEEQNEADDAEQALQNEVDDGMESLENLIYDYEDHTFTLPDTERVRDMLSWRDRGDFRAFVQDYITAGIFYEFLDDLRYDFQNQLRRVEREEEARMVEKVEQLKIEEKDLAETLLKFNTEAVRYDDEFVEVQEGKSY